MLFLADAGYFDLTYFKQVMDDGGYFMVRANKTINPTVLSVWGVEIGEKGTKLQSLLKKLGSQLIEMAVSWRKNSPEYQLLYIPDKNHPLLLLTNLSQAGLHFDQLLDIYASRWQIEMFFKELKSWNNLKGFMTRDPNIAGALIW
ncbi:transposase [Pseudoalteromonas maricaloris]|uniref:transposase n=1 Tax=Pseudoalteromonas maricaloris TaxID=184924 RepID=UPI003C1B8DF0